MACRGVGIPDQAGYLQNEPEAIQINSVKRGQKQQVTLSLSEFKISVFSSFILASRIAALVTLLNASSIRYLNDSTCFISKLYSLILLPLAPCSFSILLNTCSSFSALGTHPTTLFFPQSELGTT